MKYDEVVAQIVGWGGVRGLEEEGLIVVRQKDYEEMKQVLEKIKDMYLNEQKDTLTLLRRAYQLAEKTLSGIEGELE